MTPSRKPASAIAVMLGVFALGLAALAAPTAAVALAPKLTITQPPPTSSTTPTLVGTTTEEGNPITVKIFKGAGALGQPVETILVPVIEIAHEAWSVTPAAPLERGVYTATAEQRSKTTGKVFGSEPVTFTIDTKPVATLDPVASPTNDPAPKLAGSAGTAPGDLAKVQVEIYEGESAHGSPVVSTQAPVSAGAWSYTPAHLPDGTYTALASQGNEAGETAASAPVTFTIDTTAPVITIAKPESGQVLGVPTPTLGGVPGAASGDLQEVTAYVYTGSTATGKPIQTLHLSAGEWAAGASATALPNGIYTALAEQSDQAGNVGVSEARTFAVGAAAEIAPARVSSPPSASLQWFPAHPVAGEALWLVSTSTDAGSPITALAWAVGPQASFSAGSALLSTSFSAPGSYPVSLRVTNADGLSSTATATIVVSAPPSVLMQPFPVVRIAGSDNSGGTKIALLTVQAPLGASITVRCQGRGCPARRVSTRTVSRTGSAGSAVITFSRYERTLRPRAVLEVSVAKAGQIGKYTRLTIHTGKLPTRLDMCLSAAGARPIACPS